MSPKWTKRTAPLNWGRLNQKLYKMKNIFEIDYDGIYSSINEVAPISSWSGNPIEIDDYIYFSTQAKAKKHLVNYLKERIEDYKYAMQRIKNTY